MSQLKHPHPPIPNHTKPNQRRRVGGRDSRREEDVRGSMMRCWRREKGQESQGPRVPRSRGSKDQDISNSHSNTSLTLKKVHLVLIWYCKTLKSETRYKSMMSQFYSPTHQILTKNHKVIIYVFKLDIITSKLILIET